MLNTLYHITSHHLMPHHFISQQTQVRLVASAKDTRRTSVIAELQDTLKSQKVQLEMLQSQKQPTLKEQEGDDDDSDKDSDDDKEKEKEEAQQRVRELEAQLTKVTEWLSSLSTADAHDMAAQMAQVHPYSSS